ncbi:hypothetical protein BSCA_0756 [Bifidobacterium scardovii]|uniref:Uncharacterized protein n=1 Tax=Bifidobacterium scardovii TaxID=158787 RepID=A0A087DGQ4_9BIFI|nr:hypothetical protein BSCA_0756 [Bifidobacterium scardovii]
MTDHRPYMPRCRVCGPLGAPTTLLACMDICEKHRREYRTHKTQWVPLNSGTRILVKGTHHDCE